MMYLSQYNSPLCPIFIASDGDSLTGLWLEGQAHTPSMDSFNPESIPVIEDTKRWLDIYFKGEEPTFTPRIRITGSEFLKTVCEIMSSIPFGQTTTYGSIAKIVAEKQHMKHMSAQAVGGAVGHNPISIIIPCHRVIGTNGNLTGYAGGIDRKIELLKLEGINISNLRPPKSNN